MSTSKPSHPSFILQRCLSPCLRCSLIIWDLNLSPTYIRIRGKHIQLTIIRHHIVSKVEGIYGRSVSERRIKHYSSTHDILLVGEGDFSFSLSLAIAFRRATNIVATSLDTYDELLMKYQNARENLEMLGALGACLLHGVDATKMSFLHHIRWRKFHRIIFDFPHAGFLGKENNPALIEKHRNLVRGFLRNASSILWPTVKSMLITKSLLHLILGISRILEQIAHCFSLVQISSGLQITSAMMSLFVPEALRLGLEAYRSAEPERPLSGYISILEVLHSLSMARSEQLRQMLLHS